MNICELCDVEHLGEDCPKFDPNEPETWPEGYIGDLIDHAKDIASGN
jgi:hypothetical protein